jgi:hypothetical protein
VPPPPYPLLYPFPFPACPPFHNTLKQQGQPVKAAPVGV